VRVSASGRRRERAQERARRAARRGSRRCGRRWGAGAGSGRGRAAQAARASDGAQAQVELRASVAACKQKKGGCGIWAAQAKDARGTGVHGWR
jgi:hypothetical protein